jgi:predicted  nucleic acid-binding Zn-ribbon protein
MIIDDKGTTEKEGTTPLEQEEESELELLARLQELDRQLQEKTDSVAASEREVASMDLELSTLRQAVAAARAERNTRDTERRELEQRLEDEEAKMKDRRMRLNRVRNEKELSALRREIEVGKEANQQLEAQVLTLIQTVESLDAALAERESALAALVEKFTAELGNHRQRIAELNGEVEGERAARDRVAKGLSEELRAKYEQIFSRRGGTAVVEIRNGTCLGCHMHVPPQFFNELLKFRDVRLCPNCHRILIWRPEAAESAVSER